LAEAAPPGLPLHVMHLVPLLRVGGMEQGVVKLVNGLDRSRVRSSVVTFNAPDSLALALRPDVRLEVLAKRNGNDPRLVLHLHRLLRHHRPHIVHTHSWGTLLEGYMAARAARVPFVVHGEHGTMEEGRVNVVLQRWAWHRVDRVVSVSSRLADRLAERIGFPRERIVTIRNGVDLDRFRAVSREDARRALGLTPSQLVVGTVGRLVPVKDHANLLRAMAILRARGRQPGLVIVGEGPLRVELERLAGSLGLADSVRMLGARPDVESVLVALDVFVLSSKSEGLSNTIIEAMASGLPVVATSVGGADELVEHGRTGLLVPREDPEALAEAVAALLDDAARRGEMGRAGRAKAEREFSLERMLAGYERLYLDLAAGGSAGNVHARLGAARRS